MDILHFIALAVELALVAAAFGLLIWFVVWADYATERRRRQRDEETLHRICPTAQVKPYGPDRRPHQPATVGLDNMRRARKRHGHGDDA